jgi:(p)ppGpp synthase/HD superfamily hydrolase
MEYSLLERQAASFAATAHRDQVRKYVMPGEDARYVCHPAAVADIVRSVAHTPEMLAASWLHDVVEDCQVPLQTIAFIFGPRVSELVEMLTDVARPEDGNRKARVAINMSHTWRADRDGQTVKAADMVHNTYRIHAVAPKFAPVFMREMAAIQLGMTKADMLLMDFLKRMDGSDADDMRWLHASPETMALAVSS